MWRLDAAKIAERAADDDELYVLVVSRFTLEMLHAWQEQLLYRATFVNITDWDDLEAKLDDLRYELMPVNSLLLNKLDNIAREIRNLASNAASAPPACCDQNVTLPQPVPAPDFGDPPTPGGGISPTDWDDDPSWGDLEPDIYRSRLCDAVNGVWQSIYKQLKLLEDQTLPLLAIAAVVAMLATFFPEPVSTGLGTVTLGGIAVLLVRIAVAGLTMGEVADELQEQLEQSWPQIRENLCAAANAYELMQSWVDTVLDKACDVLRARGVPEALLAALRSFYSGDFARNVVNSIVTHAFPVDPALPYFDCACAGNTLTLTRVNFADVTVSGTQVTWELQDNGTTLSVTASGQWPEVVVTFPVAYSTLLSKVLNLVGGQREVTHGTIPTTPNCTSGYWVPAATNPPSVTSGLYTEDDSLLPEWPNRYVAASYCESRHYRIRYGGAGAFKLRLWKA